MRSWLSARNALSERASWDAMSVQRCASVRQSLDLRRPDAHLHVGLNGLGRGLAAGLSALEAAQLADEQGEIRLHTQALVGRAGERAGSGGGQSRAP